MLSLAFRLPPTTSPTAFPSPLGLPIPRSHGSHRAWGTTRSSDDSLGTASHFARAYRVPSSGATRRPIESSWSHVLVFHTVPSAHTLVWWVDENAFAPIVRARPCPTFGRPVRHWDSSHRLRPGTSPHALRIPPRGGHPALRSSATGGFRSALAVSGFRLRARLGFSIPSLSPASEALPPPLDTTPLIRAPEGLKPS